MNSAHSPLHCRLPHALTALALFALSACGGGGGGDGPAGSNPQPTVTLTASPTALTSGQATTLTWSSTNATSCSASGGWSGSKATAGSESSAVLSANTSFTLTCTGSGGSGSATASVTVTTPPPNSVVLNGRITFDRVPFKNAGQGLDPNQPVESPARDVIVEALDSNNAVIASTTTDSDGKYQVAVPQSTQIKIRVKAQMTKTGTAPTWDFKVLNNTNGGALYVLDGTLADSGTATPAPARNLRAASGWNGTTYVNGSRAAAPFAILDTVYKAKELVRSAVPDTVFPALSLFWSSGNTGSDAFCPSAGNILTSVYFAFDPGETDDCASPQQAISGIYILGNFAAGAGDTDEFDQHVIAHEFGHYLEDQFSRSDSIGGMHSIGDKLDMRVAFGEGWGDAFSGMALNDPQYKDSQNGIGAQTGFNLEADSDSVQGAYAESSVYQFLWDVFDGAAENGDGVSLGFTPIWTTFIGPEKTTDAFTSIYSFSTSLIAANPSQATAIRALLTREEIAGTNAFGANETNFGGKPTLNPVYTALTVGGGGVQVCGTMDFGTDNKFGNRRFLTFTLNSSRRVRIDAAGPTTGTPAADPDIGLWRHGLLQLADDTGTTESLTTTNALAAGTYVVEVAEFSHIDTSNTSNRRGDTCMTVSVTGL